MGSTRFGNAARREVNFSAFESSNTSEGTSGRWSGFEPNPGLVHYVESGQLVATWKEHKAFLKEEDAEIRLA